MAITVKEAQTLYVSYFGRPADFVGLQYWTGTETLVGSLEQLAHSFYNSAEGKKYFPVDPATNQIDVTASINAIYANMFGRVPETAGFDYWYNEIASGKINLAEAAVAIYRGAQGKDALMIENKIAAATQFTDQVAASDKPSLYYGDQAFAKANEFLNTVTDVTDVTSAGFAAQVNAAVNVAEAAGGASSSEGGTFTLTTGPNGTNLNGTLTNEANVNFDVPEGQSRYLTAGNDVVDLSKWGGTGFSVNIGDAFSGDNDKVTVMADKLAGPVPNGSLKLTSIENLEIINSNEKNSVILNGEKIKGLESIKLIGDATDLNVSQLTQGVKIDATADADSITGSDKADTINGGAGNDIINAGSGNDVLTGGNGADTFIVGSVQSLGIDQILDFSAEDKISMAGFTPGELKKFDASTFSTVTYKTLDSVLATFGPGGANVTKAGDVVIFSYDGKTYALLSTVAGFKETNGALVDITGANVASLTESNFGTAGAPGGSDNPTTTYANYTLFNDAVATGIPTQSAKITTMTAAQAATLATTDSGNLKYIAPEGIQAISGDNISINMTPATTFDATAFDTKLLRGIEGTIQMNITGTAGADTITASKLGGTISAGSGADRITAGAGDDTFVIVKDTGLTAAATNFASSDVAAGDTIIIGNKANIINDFATGVDKIATATSAAEAALGKTAASGFTSGSGYYLNGTYENGTFTVADNGAGTDTLVFFAGATGITTASNLQGAVVLVGAVATAADFIVAS